MTELIATSNESIRQNVARKSSFVDSVQYFKGLPLFSWIDINPTELCNRTCVFCPRVDSDLYPNQNLHMSVDLAEKMAAELASLNYEGAVTFSGYGEPLLAKNIVDLVHAFTSKGIKTEIVTNGDPLTADLVKNLVSEGPVYFVVSMYDGEHQRAAYSDIFAVSGLPQNSYILRDRWYTEDEEYGLKLTNRAGVYKYGQSPDIADSACFYPSYSMTIDWNGDSLLCVQDWNKRVKFGNVATSSLVEIWASKRLHKIRMQNIKLGRKSSPCNLCNANGCVHGFNHAAAFLDK